MKYFFYFLLLLNFLSCKSPFPFISRPGTGINKFSDITLRRIVTLQDERKTDSLLPFLQSKTAIYRREAALALASVQAKSSVPGLVALLTDLDPTVRRAAAYALGQVADTTAEASLIKFAGSEQAPAVRAELAEALGKCATQKGLFFLSRQSWSGDLEKAGLAWGLYRTHVKNLSYEKAITQAIQLLAPPNAPNTRLGAAHFLARTPKLDLNVYQEKLFAAAQSDTSPEVRMAVAQALAKIKATASLLPLQNLVLKDPDYRVRINAIRALTSADFSTIKETLIAALKDKSNQTALAAAEFLLAKAPATDTNVLLKAAGETNNWRVKATLLSAALKFASDKTAVTQEIKQLYERSENVYFRGALLLSLGQEIQNFDFIQVQTFSGASPVLATYGLQALGDMRQRENFPPALKPAFAAVVRRALESTDVALVGMAATLLSNPKLNFKEAFSEAGFLKLILAKLQLPRDMETYQELYGAIRFLESLPPAPAPPNPFTHPIDWTLVQTIRPMQKVLLTTGKGNITLSLFTEEAPATVANFVQLVRSGFFNQKNFHRVVPNFVVQGGDPRGDGFGGTDYAIRSELANLRYGEGYVGMASAGKDTESCQWFITHSPTPHLDGRYTIFARVTAGMEVVHELEIGDVISSVTLTN